MSKNPPEKLRHDPLHVEINADEETTKYGNLSRPGRRKNAKKVEKLEGEVGKRMFGKKALALIVTPQTILDSKTSRKILQLARDQQEEIELDQELEIHGSEAKRSVGEPALTSTFL